MDGVALTDNGSLALVTQDNQASWQIWITDWIWERPVRCAVAGGPETMLPKVVTR